MRSLGWLVFIELPVPEAYSLLYCLDVNHSGIIFVAALALVGHWPALFLARRMIVPIRVLSTGAAQIGAGDLSQRISITTGDELQDARGAIQSMASQSKMPRPISNGRSRNAHTILLSPIWRNHASWLPPVTTCGSRCTRSVCLSPVARTHRAGSASGFSASRKHPSPP